MSLSSSFADRAVLRCPDTVLLREVVDDLPARGVLDLALECFLPRTPVLLAEVLHRWEGRARVRRSLGELLPQEWDLAIEVRDDRKVAGVLGQLTTHEIDAVGGWVVLDRLGVAAGEFARTHAGYFSASESAWPRSSSDEPSDNLSSYTPSRSWVRVTVTGPKFD